ncbi:hypothetical protein JTB14_016087 [Gonioctena quinquepunctata]|nr:hypothetical protein JTB14_016087 [Gonioctena quinquepunctata]
MFCRSIVSTVEQLPPDLQTRAKVKVLQVISELEFEHQQRTMVHYGCRSASTGSSYSVTTQQYLSPPDQSRPSSGVTSPPYLSPIDQSGPSSAASYVQSFSPQDSPISPPLQQI